MEREKLRFSVGDTVVVTTKWPCQRLAFVTQMEKYLDKAALITDIYERFTNYWVYRLDIDNGRWAWEDSWLEPAEDELENAELPEYEELYEFLNGGA